MRGSACRRAGSCCVPEGDNVYLAASRLDRALGGRVLLRTDLRVPRYATVDLSGRVLHEVSSRGKHLLFRIEGGTTLHTHLGMDGSWRVSPPARRAPIDHRTRVVLTSERSVAVGNLLANVDLLPTSAEADVVGHLGPDPLGADWDPEEAARRVDADPDRPVIEALLDQRVLAGIGNVFACEICFLRGLHPWTPVSEIGDVDGLLSLSKRLLEANRSLGRQVTTGDLRPGRGRWVYGRAGRPCRRCGHGVAVRHPDGPEGRVTYWCPACQPPTLEASSRPDRRR